MLFQGILLDCFQKINQERTTSSVYNLLTGKKAIQTIQDASFYQTANYYGIYSTLTKDTYNNQLKRLIEEGYFIEDSEKKLQTTKKGKAWLAFHSGELNGFYGSKFANVIEPFQQRLLLFIQTLTNTSKKQYQFIPITDNYEIEQFVKSYYGKYKHRSLEVLEQIYKELENALSDLTDQEAAMFVDRITSYYSYGSSLQQLSQDYQLSIPDCFLSLQKGFYHLLKLQEEGSRKYPMLNLFTKNLRAADTPLSQTAQYTLRLLQKKHSIKEIMQIRQLKSNTIEDHLVEIAMNKAEFPFFDYFDAMIYEEIKGAVHLKQTYRLKEIKNKVNPEISYFQIRLALVLYNRQGGEKD